MTGPRTAIGIALAICMASSSNAQTSAPNAPAAPTAPPSCSTPAHRQFDFWVGQWDVYPAGSDVLVAKSLIENLYDGCAVRENWMPLKGSTGGSINIYRSKTGEWRQIWVDSGNEVHEYRGHWTGKAMEFEGEAKDAGELGRKVRMTFEPLADGSVVQTGYKWSDKGWVLEYQFHYRRAHSG